MMMGGLSSPLWCHLC